jgi:phospholipid/cholesterol/gamma-HCH transport system permease protein
MLTEGAWAEVRVGSGTSQSTTQGMQASVCNLNTKSWIAPSEPVEDLEHGKAKSRASQNVPEASRKFRTSAVEVGEFPGIDSRFSGLRILIMSTIVRYPNDLISEFLGWFGELGIFFWQVLRAAVTPPFEFRELFRQLDEIGSKSLPLVALAGAAIGVVLSLETRYSLTRFGAKSLLPAAIVFSVIHETGPIITGLVVSGRAGAGIGAELASMKVTEQIDAIEASAVNPFRLLAATRIVACVLMLPLLTLAADLCGVVFGWVAQALVEPISLHQFIDAGFKGANFNDFLPP